MCMCNGSQGSQSHRSRTGCQSIGGSQGSQSSVGAQSFRAGAQGPEWQGLHYDNQSGSQSFYKYGPQGSQSTKRTNIRIVVKHKYGTLTTDADKITAIPQAVLELPFLLTALCYLLVIPLFIIPFRKGQLSLILWLNIIRDEENKCLTLSREKKLELDSTAEAQAIIDEWITQYEAKNQKPLPTRVPPKNTTEYIPYP